MENAFDFTPSPEQVTLESLDVAKTQQDTPTFDEGFRAAVEYDGTIPALINQYHGPKYQPDPSYYPSDEDWKGLTADLPPEEHHKLIQATSPAHAEFLREHLLEEQKLAGIVAQKPWAAVAAGLTDPGVLAASVLSGPFAISARSTVLMNALRTGAYTGAENVGIGVTLKAIHDRDYTFSDGASDFFFGAAIGTPLGALASPGEQAMARAAASHNSRNMVKEDAAAMGLTPAEPNLGSTGAMATDSEIVFRGVKEDGQKSSRGVTFVTPEEGAAKVYGNVSKFHLTKLPPEKVLDLTEFPAVAKAEAVYDKVASVVGDDVADKLFYEIKTSIADEMDVYKLLRANSETLNMLRAKGIAVVRYKQLTGETEAVSVAVLDDTMLKPSDAFASGGAMATDMNQVAQPIDDKYATTFEMENTPKSALTHLKIKLPFFGEMKVPLRFDMRARLGSSENPVARYMGSVLGGESVGLVGKGVVRESAAEWAMFHQLELGSKVGKAWREGYGGWVRDNKVPHSEAISGARAAKFDIEVGRALRGETDVSPQASQVAASMAQQQKRILELAKKHGVEGFDDLAANPYYAMRMFNHKRIEDLNNTYGTGNLENLLSNSLRKVRPDWDAAKLAKVSKGYLKAVRVVGRDKQLPKAGAYAQKDREYFMEKLKANGFEDETADDIMELLSSSKSEGGHARSKARLPLDETHREPLKNNLTGAYDDVSISDLFEQNGSVLFNTYLRQMSGQVALAQVGIKSEAQFKRLMTDMLNDGRGDTEAYARYAQAMYDHVVGRPIFTDDFGKLTDVARIIGGLNYTRMANQFGFAQIAEMGQFMSPTYIRAFINGMPAFKDILEMARGGKFTSKMARDIEEAIGYGGEFNLHRPTARSDEDIADGLRTNKVVHQLDRLSQVSSTISGLRSVNNMERGVTANVVIQRLSNWAIKGNLAQKDIDELAYLGLSKANTEAVFGDMKKYLEYKDSELVPGAKVKGINYQKWQEEAPDTYDKFRFTVHRETDRIILNPDIGKTPYILHHPLMKPLFQFRRFMLAAYSSHLLRGMHNMNIDTAAAFAGSMFLGGMAYVAQTGLNFANDPENLEKRLAPEEIAKAAFNRAGFSSLLPMATDSALGMLGYDPQFAYGRNSTLPSGMLVGNPSVDFANKLWNTAGTAAGAITGNRDATQSDIKAAFSLLPFNNAVGVRNLGHMLSQQFPKYDPNETYEPQ